jgi:hypothetical protein
MKWNRAMLKKDIAEDTRIIRGLKTLRKEKGSLWDCRDDRDLRDAKRRATIRHAIAASLRGKIHLTNWRPRGQRGTVRRPMTEAEQQALIEKALPQYIIQEAEVAA